MKTKLFINHQYEVISNNENYCFENIEGDYLAMYEVSKKDAIFFISEGYSLIINGCLVF